MSTRWFVASHPESVGIVLDMRLGSAARPCSCPVPPTVQGRMCSCSPHLRNQHGGGVQVTAVSESRTGQGEPGRTHLGRIFQAYFGCVHHGRSLGSPLRNTTSFEVACRSRCQEMGILRLVGGDLPVATRLESYFQRSEQNVISG